MKKQATLTRGLILEILLEVEKGEFSHLVMKSVLDKYSYLENEDKTFIKRLASGCIERRITLDYIIDQFSKTKANKCKSVIRNILRMGVYQIYYMDSVPDSAAVNEAVKLCMDKGFVSLKGFVNGVLRSISRAERITDFPDSTIKYSVGAEVMAIIKEGIEANTTLPLEKTDKLNSEMLLDSLLSASLEPAPLYAHVMTSKIDSDECIKAIGADACAEKSVYFDDALILKNVKALNELSEFVKGNINIQDISSMVACALPEIKEGMRVLDLCAAPGGKTFNIADRLNGSGEVISCDLTEAKTALIEENRDRLGLSNVTIYTADALSDNRAFEEESFDLIIADLPCSGLGVMGRKLDLKYRVSSEDVIGLSKLQREILDKNIKYLKAGGQLLFSTCTITKAENIDNFTYIKDTLGLIPVSIEDRLPEQLQGRTGSKGYIQLLPGLDKCDGFFAALFMKK